MFNPYNPKSNSSLHCTLEILQLYIISKKIYAKKFLVMVLSHGNWTNLMFEWSHKLGNKNQVAIVNVASFREIRRIFGPLVSDAPPAWSCHCPAIHPPTPPGNKKFYIPPKNPKNQFSLSMDLHHYFLQSLQNCSGHPTFYMVKPWDSSMSSFTSAWRLQAPISSYWTPGKDWLKTPI